MSAPEPTAVAPVEEVKPTDATPAVETKVEEPAAITEVVDPVVEASPVTDAEPAATEEPPKEETKPEAKEAGPKGIFRKFFETVKGRVKSPKKEALKLPADDAQAPKEAVPDAPAVIDPPKDDAVVPEPSPEQTESAAPVPATAPVPAAVPNEAEVKPAANEEKTALKAKIGRRLSARVGDFFKPKSKSEVTTPLRVAENPPMIDVPEPVAPLDNPASEAAKVEEPSEPAEVTTPVIAAAA
jgi:hypothetical protein